MRKIIISSLKRFGFSVGYLDADITATTGSEAFGLEKAPDWELDATVEGGKGAIIPLRCRRP